MSDRITLIGTGLSVEPLLILAVSTSAASRSIVHPIINRKEPEVTLAPLGTMTGTIELLHESAIAAASCVDLHSRVGVFDLTCETLPAWSRRYIVEGNVTSALDPATRTQWIVTIGYRSVAP